MLRSLEAPEKEWSDDKDAATWLGIPVGTLLALAAEGLIPGPKKWNKRDSFWHWETLLMVSFMLKSGFVRPEEKAGVPEKPVK